MGHGYKSGAGGASLNFKVVGGTTEPANPKENMIWVNTSNTITGWYFTATQPENMAEGELWFATGASSDRAFNALKKNGIYVYPLSAKQYVGGAWVEKTAKIYKNGAWIDWALTLYKEGKKQVEFAESGVGSEHSATWDTDSVSLYVKTSSGKGDAYQSIHTEQIINSSKLIVKYKDAYGIAVKGTKLVVGLSTGDPTITISSNVYVVSNAITTAEINLTNTAQSGEIELDISHISGTQTVFVVLWNNSKGYDGSRSSTAKITEIVMR